MTIKTLLGFAILAGVAITFVTPKPGHMLELVPGNYECASDTMAEDFNAFLKAMEFSDENREKIRKLTKIRLEVKCLSEGEYSYSFFTNLKNYTQSFTLDKEFDQVICDGRKSKTLFTPGLLPNVVMHRMTFDGFSVIGQMMFCKDGVKVIRTAKDATVIRQYKRV